MIPKRVSSIRESYKDFPYKKGHPKYVTYKQYRTGMEIFLEEVMYQMITTGQEVVFPLRMGTMQVVRYKRSPGHKAINYQLTKEAAAKKRVTDSLNHIETVVRHDNLLTNGYWPRVHWFKGASRYVKKTAKFKYCQYVAFRPSRPNLRPNTYNKHNPRVSLYPYFREKMWNRYREL